MVLKQREIRFRCWDEVMHEMSVDFVMTNLGKVISKTRNKEVTEASYFVGSDKFILMQFTGLLDRSGKEIYEGDIVRYTAVVERNVFKVIFRNGRFIAWSSYTEHDLYFLTKNPEFDPNECEVIGNVFQNKNLLK